ncbi:MAG: SDR family oxidoreductase [Roseateles sp.]|jgi:NAD(P)-dependent dehydrogenase (short-subunit alcohol dehydrogenase family)|nr:short chain dehydrogenase [Methylibium sp.]|mmetsp:Transcript_26217/g.61878  ORF Transcript_26217/g.61878 Transcript_26217/m.61878 type:complete len:222 (+) Transcript_26217:2162-2827(+)
MNVLIIGASRGLGLEFVRQYRAAGAAVVASARDEAGRARIAELGAKPLTLDVASAAGVSGLAWQIDGERFDVVVINAGVFGPRAGALDAPTQDDFDTVMHTNVLGPMRLLPQLADALAPGARLAILSSRMGSIGLRASSSGWLYRASKAAVNSVMKDASLALAGQAIVISFHPGWVKTDMGGEGADIDAATSIAGMRTVLATLKPTDTGSFFNYDGQRLAW